MDIDELRNMDAGDLSPADVRMGLRTSEIVETSTKCCALAFISVTNETGEKDLKEYIRLKMLDSRPQAFAFSGATSGERALIVSTLASERMANKLLEKLGFQRIAEINRRTCYDQRSTITLWLLSW